MAAAGTVKLYQYSNNKYDGSKIDPTLRLVAVYDAKETPTAYTYPNANRDGWGRNYDMVRKDEIGRVPYGGVGEIWLLADDMEKARTLLLDKLCQNRAREIREMEQLMHKRNLHIVALGGYADYPDFTREVDGS